MRVVVAIKGSGRGGASNAARYIAESKLDPGREGEETRKLFSEREDGLSYRKADRYLSGGRLAPEKSDLIHFSVSFQAEDFAQLGSSDEERKQILRGAAREAMDQLKTELRAGDWRWAAGVHLNTDHPHLHVLIHKEIVDRETEKPRRIGRIPKRLLAHRESVAGGELRSVEGVLGQWFLDSLDRARPQEREAALDNPGKKNDSAARARALSSSETLSLVAEKNPSIAGRELLQEIIERGPAPEPKEPPEVRNPRVAFKSRGFDDPDYRSRPEQADWLGHESRDLRELYERGASVVGDVLIIPAEEHEITNSNEEPFITSLAYALNRIKNPQQAQEFHALARTIAGETADAKTLLEVFRYYYARSQQDEAGRHISPGKKDERDAAIGRTIEEMRPLAGEMAMLETRESLEVALPTVSLDERHEGQDGESSGRAYNIAARKVSLSDDSLRFPAGLDLETKERLVGRTAPAIDKLLEGGSSREQVFASIDLSLYPPDLSERELEERSRIGRFLKAYVNERLKDPETRALNRSAAFRQAHSQITQARTPEDLNRAAESFLRENFASFRGNAGKPEEKPLNARERALLFSGRAPNHHTAEMRELRYAWGLSRVEREQRVEALRAGMLTPSPALEAMLTELGNRSTSPALRHYRASILSPQMRNPGKLDLRRLHQRLPKYERDFLFQKIEEREKGLAADRVSPPLSQSLVPAQEPAAKAPADAARPSGSIGEYQQAVEEIDSLRAGLIRDRNRWVAAAGNRAPKSERKSADRRVGDLTAEREQDRRILGDVLLKTAARDCAVLDFETARDHGETFRFKVYDASLNTQRRISSLDVERRAGARADRAADLHGATSAEDRHAIHQKVAREDLAGHAQTLKEHEKTRERLIGKLEAEATEAQAAHGQAQRLAEAVVQKYVQRGETLPSPFVERKALMATLEKAVDHRFADHTEKLERLRGDLAQEHKQLMRSDREAARLAAQLFIAETELGAREERAERFARTRHLTKWEIGGEKLSLADVDRRIERQTDEARLMGRFQMHLDPYARAKASEEIERLSVVREEILVKIGERESDLREKAEEAGKLFSILEEAHRSETALRAGAGLTATDPEFLRKEIERAADNIETMRDAGLLRRLDVYETRFDRYAAREESFGPEEIVGRALGREVRAEIFEREALERLATFDSHSNLQPILLEKPSGELSVHRTLDLQPRTVVEWALRPLVETAAEKEFRGQVSAARDEQHHRLLAEVEKTREYLDAAREIGGVRTRESIGEPGKPLFTSKQTLEIEIFAERLTDAMERGFYLDLARAGALDQVASLNAGSSGSPPDRPEPEVEKEVIEIAVGRGR